MTGHPQAKTWYKDMKDHPWTDPTDMKDPETGEILKGFIKVELEGPHNLFIKVCIVL